MSWKFNVLGGALIAVAAWSAFNALTAHYIAVGDRIGAARVLGQWDEQVEKDRLIQAQSDAEQARLAQERQGKARVLEAERQSVADKVAHEQAQREKSLADRAARLTADVRSLHTTIATLNAERAAYGDADVSGSSAIAATAAESGAAALARGLLGQCADRYQSVATAAAGFRDQVIGLQQFVAGACPATQPEASSTQ